MNESRHLNGLPEAKILQEGELQSLIRPAQQGDEKAREAIIRSNIRLVLSIIQRFYNRGYELEDLFQIGCIGLLKAIDRYNPDYGVRFSTYAVPLIIGEIRRFMRDDGPIHVARSIKELATTVYRVKERLTEAKGYEPSVEEVASELGISSGQVVECTEAVKAPASLQALATGDECNPGVIDQLGSDTDQMEDYVDRIALKEALKLLPARSREIVIGRYFRNESQAVIAQRLGLSQVQVSRLERQTLVTLRSAFLVNASR